MLIYLDNVLSVSETNPGLVLHIGAGKAAELERYQSAGFEEIVLAEAFPEFAQLLRRKVRNCNNVIIEEVLVTATGGGSQQLNVCNNLRYSSLLDLLDGSEYLPNLEVTGTIQVEGTALIDLLRRQRSYAGKTNLLVLETLGVEKQLLGSVPVALLRQFDLIALRAAQQSVYAGGSTIAEIVDFLKDAGYDLTYSDASMKPFTELLFRQNSKAILLEDELSAAQMQASESQLLIESLSFRADELEEQALKLISGFHEAVAGKDKLELQNAEHLSQRERNEAEIAELVTAGSKSASTIESLRNESSALARETADLETRLDITTAERRELKEILAQLRLERDVLWKGQVELKSQLEISNAEVSQLRQLSATASTELERLKHKEEAQVGEIADLQHQASALELRAHELMVSMTELEKQRDDLVAAAQALEQGSTAQSAKIVELKLREQELETQLDNQTSKVSALADQKAELNAEIEQLNRTKQMQHSEIVELQTKISAFSQETKRIEDLTASIVMLKTERDELLAISRGLEANSAEQASIVDALELREADLQRMLANSDGEVGELQRKIDQLEPENQQLRAQTQALEAQLAELRATESEFEDKAKHFERENQELVYRQTLLDQQIVKAEAQLELISDVILREKPSDSPTPDDEALDAAEPRDLPSEFLGGQDEYADLTFIPRVSMDEAIARNDRSMISNARSQWFFGDWKELSELDLRDCKYQPDAGKLAVLKAAGYQQLNDPVNCESNLRLARELGCDDRFIARIMIAGVHNTLGNIAALKQDDQGMIDHYTAALDVGERAPSGKHALKARSVNEMARLGLLPQVESVLESDVAALRRTRHLPREQEAQLALMRLELKAMKAASERRYSRSKTGAERKLILVASIPRSGSTWLYNCVKHVLSHQSHEFYSSYVKSYEDNNPAIIHVVKLHTPDLELAAAADAVITTRRDIREVAASLKRMDWAEVGDKFYSQLRWCVNTVHPFWHSRTNLEVEYNNILQSPALVVEQVGHALSVHLTPQEAETISRQLQQLESPAQYDEETQLHPSHRADKDVPYEELLGQDTSGQISQMFHDWLSQYGYIQEETL